MSEFRVGIELSALKLPLKRALATAAQLGADGVAIDARGEIRPSNVTNTGMRQLRKMLDDLQLKVSSVTFQTRRGYQVVDDLERRIEATKNALDFAYQLGCNVVTNQIGRIPEDGEEAAWQTLRESLTDIGRHSQKCGAFLCARTGSEDASQVRTLIDQLPAGSMFVDLDPGNLIVNGFSASEALTILGRDIQHVHARDAVRDLAIGRGLEVGIGQGSVDFAELVATLEQFGYRGFLTVDRQQSTDPIGETRDAVQYLRAILRG